MSHCSINSTNVRLLCFPVFSLNTTGRVSLNTKAQAELQNQEENWPSGLSVGAGGLVGQDRKLTTVEAVWSLKP